MTHVVYKLLQRVTSDGLSSRTFALPLTISMRRIVTRSVSRSQFNKTNTSNTRSETENSRRFLINRPAADSLSALLFAPISLRRDRYDVVSTNRETSSFACRLSTNFTVVVAGNTVLECCVSIVLNKASNSVGLNKYTVCSVCNDRQQAYSTHYCILRLKRLKRIC